MRVGRRGCGSGGNGQTLRASERIKQTGGGKEVRLSTVYPMESDNKIRGSFNFNAVKIMGFKLLSLPSPCLFPQP